MRKILFNNILKSENYVRHFEYLFSDYDLFRKKHFSGLCLELLQPIFRDSKLFLAHSATGALEMIAHLLDIREGDEVIMPSFTFVSTANAFVSRGAVPVFADIDPETLNIDVSLVEAAITDKTKAIVAVHYGGNPCDLRALKNLCEKHRLFLIEDAAMGFGNQFEGLPLGSCGDFGVISFDITKQISAVQGGLLLVNNPEFASRADNIYHIGTDRSAFQQGNKPYYEWVDTGSKFQMNELNAVVLYEYLLHAQEILERLKKLAGIYDQQLMPLAEQGFFRIVPSKRGESAVHQYCLLMRREAEREALSAFLAASGIEALFHYVPLHNSVFGKKKGRHADMTHTENIAGTLLRLPMHTGLTAEEVELTCEKIKSFFHERG